MQLIYHQQFHPFGQPSRPSGSSQSVFGQQNNSSYNPFAPNPFGNPTPFGSEMGNSMSGGTSTGVFGAAQTSSPFSSNTTFGASSSPAFNGSSMPAFGASSTPAFGSSMPAFGASSTPVLGNLSSSFGGSSCFGQVPAFGGFGSTPTQISPFGSVIQPSLPTFGSNIFGLTGTPAFGATGTPASSATSAPAICATSTPVFFVTSTPVFYVTSTPVFFVTNTPAFGSTSIPAFDCTGSSFGASSSPVFGSSSTSAFEASRSPASGASAFGQSNSVFGTSSPFGRTTSAFEGSQTPAPAFGNTGIGQLGFGGQRSGSRVASYSTTTEADREPGKFKSISAMHVYRDKSHEELRWEDYQLGDKGEPLASAPEPTGTRGWQLPTCPCSLGSSHPALFCPSSTNPFYRKTPNSYPFAVNTSTFSSGFGTSAPAFSSSAFGSSTSAAEPSILRSSTSLFGDNSSSQAFRPSTSLFGDNSSSQAFRSSTSLFGDNPSSQEFRPSTSLFNTAARGTSSPFGTSIFRNTQPSQLFSSAAPANAQSASAFGQNTSPFGQTAAFSQSSLFSSPPSGLVGNIFSSGSSLSFNDPTGCGQTAPSMSTPFQSAQPAQSSGTFSFSNFGQTEPVGASSFNGTPVMFGQNNFGPQAIPQSSMVAQAAPITNPFGTLPALPQMSTGRVGTTPSVQYGISSMPSGFGGRPSGSRIASYSATAEADSGTSGQTANLESISAMPVYRDKSHEELKWEDYLGDKGGSLASAPQSTGMAGCNSSTTQTNTSPSPVFGQS